MTQDQYPDGQQPFQPSPHGTPAPGGHSDSVPPQTGGDESWLLEDGGALEASAMEDAGGAAPGFGAPPVGEVEAGWQDPGLEGAGAGESWLMDGDGEPQAPAPSEPAFAAEPMAGDAPSMLETSYVAPDAIGHARGLLVPVTLGALALVGGLTVFQLRGGSGDDAAPEAIALTEDRGPVNILVDPRAQQGADSSDVVGTRQSISRGGELGEAVPQLKAEGAAQRQSQAGGSAKVQDARPAKLAGKLQPERAGKPQPAEKPQQESKPGLSSVEQALASASEGPAEIVARPGQDAQPSRVASAGQPVGIGPLGPPPPFAWHEVQSQAEAELALKGAPSESPSMLVVAQGETPQTAAVEPAESGPSDADLMAWLESEDDLPFFALGYASEGPEMVAPELPVQGLAAEQSSASSETQAAVAVDPEPSVNLEPMPAFAAGMPLTLEPLWPGFELDSELFGPDSLFDDELVAQALAAPLPEPQAPWDVETGAPAKAEDQGAVAQTNLLPGPLLSLPSRLPGTPVRTLGQTPEDGFSLGLDPVQWAAKRAIELAEAEVQNEASAAEGSELLATEEDLLPSVDEIASLNSFAELLAEAEAQAELDLAELELAELERAAAELASEERGKLAAEEPAQPGPEPTVTVADLPSEVAQEIDEGGEALGAEVASVELPAGTEVNPGRGAAGADTRSLLQTYSDWMRIQDMAPDQDPVLSGLTGVPGHQNLPYGLAQLGTGEVPEASTLDLGVEVGSSHAPRRGGVLRRASGDHRWNGVEVPTSNAVSAGRKLLTPNVGPVRVNLVDGESLEGRLHAVGYHMVWLETSLGRMSLEERRVDQIVKLDPRHVITAPGAKRDYSRFPRVRVTAKGGIFIGHQLSRTEDRITLVTDDGSRITLENVEVMPARQFRSVGLVRNAGSEKAPSQGAGSPASPK